MASRVFNRPDLDEIVVALNRPSALVELGVFLVCLFAGWLAVRLIRGPNPRPGSVLFGERVIDGVLFPVFALAFAIAARFGLEAVMKPGIFRLAVPILLLLVLIRLVVRILTRELETVRSVHGKRVDPQPLQRLQQSLARPSVERDALLHLRGLRLVLE